MYEMGEAGERPGGGARIGVDIGGTFTDLALEMDGRQVTAKVLTTPAAPEQGVLKGIAEILGLAEIRPEAVGLIVHGTTLATNALIERRGARTAVITTQGFRDILAIGLEDRCTQYSLGFARPEPLVPRHLRFAVPERMDARGRVVVPLDEAAVDALVPELDTAGIESVAVAFLHAYANPAHEQRTRERLARTAGHLRVSLSSEICPEIREYERLSTTVANAYVQPLVARYLRELEARLKASGLACPLLLMTSAGAVMTLEAAMAHPVRLVESGPAGGSILARQLAQEQGLPRVLSFDMGGTTAKLALIDDGVPEITRQFEVARAHRFLKGSGMPLRIPVVEMVEIGAGGGSVARLDALGRIAVGPESAGSDPGPACYDLGGTAATVTDADVVLGHFDAEGFAGGRLRLLPARASEVVERDVGRGLGGDALVAAHAVAEVIDEAMAGAARVHALERGRTIQDYTMIAFGGAAPLHAASLARKLDIRRVLIPVGAGVGSALGFLRAPIAFQAARSTFQRLDALDVAEANALVDGLLAEAEAIVAGAAPDRPVHRHRVAQMRYVGQGHEIPVPLPDRPLGPGDGALLAGLFAEAYAAQYGRVIPGLDVEILSWSVEVSTDPPARPRPRAAPERAHEPPPDGERQVFDQGTIRRRAVPFFHRHRLRPGARLDGPALIGEEQTTIVVPADFRARIDRDGHVVLDRTEKPQ